MSRLILKSNPPPINEEPWNTLVAELDAIESWAIDEVTELPDPPAGASQYSPEWCDIRLFHLIIEEVNAVPGKLRVIKELLCDVIRATRTEEAAND